MFQWPGALGAAALAVLDDQQALPNACSDPKFVYQIF